MGLQRVRHNLATEQQRTTIEKDKHYVISHSLTHTYAHTENLHNVICQLYLNKAEGKRKKNVCVIHKNQKRKEKRRENWRWGENKKCGGRRPSALLLYLSIVVSVKHVLLD